MTRKIGVAVVALVVGILAGTPVYGSVSELSDEDIQSFENHLRQSGEYLGEEEFALAIEELRDARELIDHPRIAIRMGQAYDEWGRCLDAEQTYLELLDRDDVSESDREGIQGLLDELGSCVEPGRLTVDCQPERTTIEMSGGDLEGPRIINCPIDEDVAAGEYRLQGRAEGHQEATISVRVEEGDEIRASLRLSPESEEPDSVDEPDVPEVAEEPDSGRHTLNWVGMGAMGTGVLMLAGGGILDLRAGSRNDDLAAARDDGDVQRVRDLQDSASRARTATWALYGTGLAMVGGGLALTLMSFDSPDEEGLQRRGFNVEVSPSGVHLFQRW